jgi:hypothetical protein
VRVPPVVRLGCAGVAVIAIAALTSIGLFAVVAGGLPFGTVATRAAASGAPVLVTIQALPPTPTGAAFPTATAVPASLIPARAIQPPPAPTAPPTSQPASQPVGPSAQAATSTPVPSPKPLASPQPETPPAAPATTASDPERTATHDGLLLELAGSEHGWQPATTEAAPGPGREAAELLTIDLRFTNQAGDVRYVADADVLLVGDDGSRYAPRQTGAHREPRLLTVPVPANDSLRGWLTYEVPPGTALRGLQWSPTRPDRPRAEATYMIGLPR